MDSRVLSFHLQSLPTPQPLVFLQDSLTTLVLSTLKITATTLLLTSLFIVIHIAGRTLGKPLGYLIDDILTDEARDPDQRETDAKCAGSIIGFLLWVSGSVFEGLRMVMEGRVQGDGSVGIALGSVVVRGAWDAVVMVAVLGCVVKVRPRVKKVVEGRMAVVKSGLKIL